MRRPVDLWLLGGVSGALLLGCVATWVVMDMRLRREREAIRQELAAEVEKQREAARSEVKEGIKEAADEVLSTDYLKKRADEEAAKLAKDPASAAATAADTTLKAGVGVAKGVLGAVNEHEEDLKGLGAAAGRAARAGLEAFMEAAGKFQQGPPAPGDDEKTPRERDAERDSIDPQVGGGKK